MARIAAPELLEDPNSRSPSAPSGALRRRIADWGWRRALYWQIMHALGRFLGFHIHYVRIGADRPDIRSPDAPQIPPGYEVKLGCRDDFLPFMGSVIDADFIETAFSEGDECSLTLHKGELVNFCFCSRSRAPVNDQLDVLVPKGFRYVYKSWTHPDHRRRNLSRMGSYLRNNFAPRPFSERSISYVATHNYASLLHSRRDPREHAISMGYVGWFTVFGRQIPFTSRKARAYGFEFVRKEDRRVRQTVL